MTDRADIKMHIHAAPIYNRCIISAYALSDSDASKYNCGTQESALGGRGIIATTLAIFGTITAPKI